MNQTIVHEEANQRGSFHFEQDGQRLAELSYGRIGPALVVIDHTWVDPALRGQGVARRLLDAAVQWARESHTGVMATCSYASIQFERDPGIRDVFAG